MVSFNKVMLMGNLTRDPELRYTAGGSPVCDLGLAVNRRYHNQNDELKEEVCFVTVTVWGKQAESCSEYLNKGKSIFVEGRLKQESWEAEDGKKRSTLKVVAENVQFLGRSSNQPGSDEPGAPKDNTHKDDMPLEEEIPF